MISRVGTGITDIFTYDVFGRLTSANVGNNRVEYEYDYRGLRTSKTVNNERTDYILSGDNVLAESKNGAYQYYYRGIGLIGYTDYIGNNYVYKKNAHGDISATVDMLGNTVYEYTYDAYGNEDIDYGMYRYGGKITPTLTDTNPYRYAGEYYDLETGFIYLRARYYDPTLGRFISEDPICDGINWYSYCAGDPINFVDPWGMEAEGNKGWLPKLPGFMFIYCPVSDYGPILIMLRTDKPGFQFFEGTVVEPEEPKVDNNQEKIDEFTRLAQETVEMDLNSAALHLDANPDGVNGAWCAWLVSSAAKKAGVPLVTHNYVNTLAELNGSTSDSQYKPKVGDIAYINNNDENGPIMDHVGIVVDVNQNTITTIEGNMWSDKEKKSIVKNAYYNLSDRQGTHSSYGEIVSFTDINTVFNDGT